MGTIPAFLLRHTVTVDAYQGAGPAGPVYGTPVSVRCFQDDKRRMVRSDTGDQVVAETTLYARLDSAVKTNDRVTLIDGRKTTVLGVRRHDGGGLPTPDHVEVLCG